MKKYSKYLMMILMLVFPACGAKNDDMSPEMFLTPPAMRVIITRKNCPFMEVQVGTQVMWVSGDTATIPITLEELDDHGNVITTGKSEINAENQFSVGFDHAEVYHLYCSEDRDAYATITVK